VQGPLAWPNIALSFGMLGNGITKESHALMDGASVLIGVLLPLVRACIMRPLPRRVWRRRGP
jgi:hypothetical protein